MSRFLCIPYFYHMTLLHQIKNLSEVVYDFSEHRTSNILLFCTKAKRPTSLHQLQILCSVFCTIKKGRVFLDGLNSGEMFVNFSFSEIILFFLLLGCCSFITAFRKQKGTSVHYHCSHARSSSQSFFIHHGDSSIELTRQWRHSSSLL